MVYEIMGDIVPLSQYIMFIFLMIFALVFGLLLLLKPEFPTSIQNWLTHTILKKENAKKTNLTLNRVIGIIFILVAVISLIKNFLGSF